ncbi:MAG: AMP-binding protein [Bryobacteraceae bacterium]
MVFRDRIIAYIEVRDRVDSLAAILLDSGFQKGDRIGLYSDNCPFFAITYLATIRAGLCAVPFAPGTDQKLFRAVVDTAGMRCAFVQQKHLRNAQEWSREPGLRLLPEPWVEERWLAALAGNRRTSALKAPLIDPERDLAVLAFTSGSTGTPKAVMVTHRNIRCNTEDIIRYMRLTERDRVMAVLPLSYCFGASLLHTHLRAGASVVLASSFMFPEKILDEMEARGCTGFAGVPSTYQILLRKTNFSRRRFPALQWLQQAGGKLPASVIAEVVAAQPDARLYVMYGQTEATARLSYLEPSMLAAKRGSIGMGLASTRLEVLNQDGVPVAAGSEEVGEIVASGPNISPGYWNSPEETARFFRNGRLYTGDLARVDRDGFLYIVDRARDFIKSAGNRISPQEIEEVIASHPDVLHVAVVGVPDELLGEAVAAFAVPRAADCLSEASLKDYCNERLPNHKVPQHIQVMGRLPMNDFGKVLKEELRSTIGAPRPGMG